MNHKLPVTRRRFDQERAEFDALFEHTFVVQDRDVLAMLNVGEKLVLSLCLPETRMIVRNATVYVKSIDMERRLLTVIEDRS